MVKIKKEVNGVPKKKGKKKAAPKKA